MNRKELSKLFVFTYENCKKEIAFAYLNQPAIIRLLIDRCKL